jgi:hypothetical protein
MLDTGLRRYDIIAGFMWLCKCLYVSSGLNERFNLVDFYKAIVYYSVINRLK